MAVYLGFDPREDLFPEVHVIPGRRSLPRTFAMCYVTGFGKISAENMSPENQPIFVGIFHSFFHRCGKLW